MLGQISIPSSQITAKCFLRCSIRVGWRPASRQILRQSRLCLFMASTPISRSAHSKRRAHVHALRLPDRARAVRVAASDNGPMSQNDIDLGGRNAALLQACFSVSADVHFPCPSFPSLRSRTTGSVANSASRRRVKPGSTHSASSSAASCAANQPSPESLICVS